MTHTAETLISPAELLHRLERRYDAILHLKEQRPTMTVIRTLGFRADRAAHARSPKVRFDRSERFLHV